MSVIEMIVPMLFDIMLTAEILREQGLATQEDADRVRADTGASNYTFHTDHGYDINLQRNEAGAYDVVAHWTQQPGKTRVQKVGADLAKTIRQRYAYEKVKRELAKKGFIISDEEVQADNSIKVVARKW